MRDRREEILARLAALVEPVMPGRVYRNRLTVSGTMTCITINDGDEETAFDPRTAGSGQMVAMQPEMRIKLEDRAANVGPALNGYRVQVLRAIFADCRAGGQLERREGTVIGPQGRVVYNGLGNDAQRGTKVEGELWFFLRIDYPLLYAELLED